MANLFTDPFTRADSTSLGANWAEDSLDSSIATNRLRLASVASSSPAFAATTTSAHAAVADQKVTLTVINATLDGGPCARRTSSGVFYAFDVYNSGGWKAEIYRHSSLTVSVLVATAALGSAHSAGDTYSLEVQGTALRGYKNGVLQVSGTDSNITAAGQAGAYSWLGVTADYDDYSVDDFSSSGSASVTAPPAQTPNRFVGPMALRLTRHSPVPYDLTQAPATDTNFGVRVRVPNNQVGPPVLRALYRSPTFLFDITRFTASGNRIRRVICSSSDA